MGLAGCALVAAPLQIGPAEWHPPRDSQFPSPFYLAELDTYAYAMWLLSLCKLMRLDALVPRVVGLFDVERAENRGQDVSGHGVALWRPDTASCRTRRRRTVH